MLVNKPQARKALLSQQILTGKQNNCVFHDPRSNQPWKDDQAMRKTVWTPALKKAEINYRDPYQTRHIFASTLLTRDENPLWVAQHIVNKDWRQIRKIYGRRIRKTIQKFIF